MAKVGILVLGSDEAGQVLLDQVRSRHPQEIARGQIGFQDPPLLVHGEVADRGQLVEIEVASPRGLELLLRLAQLVVLHLQLDLVYL